MSIKLKGSSDGSVSLDAPADTSPSGSDITLTLPTSAGSADQFLKNSGIAGELEYSSMVETSTGLGIGTSSPRGLVHLHSSSAPRLDFTNTTTGTGSGDGATFSVDGSTGALNIIQRESQPIQFYTNNTERARLDSSGRLLVGLTSSTGNHALEVNGGTFNEPIKVESSDAGAYVRFEDDDTTGSTRVGAVDNDFKIDVNSSERLRIFSTGASTFRADSYGIGVRSIAGSSSVNTAYFGAHSSTSISTGSITFEVYTNGNVKNTNNSYGQLSDERLKENIINAPSQWDDIKALQIRKYNFREGNGYDTHTQIGLVAQEVETVCPGLVQQTPVREDATPVLDAEGNELEATKSVLTSVLYMKAVKALQEAQTRIETLESQHADLLARVTALEAA